MTRQLWVYLGGVHGRSAEPEWGANEKGYEPQNKPLRI